MTNQLDKILISQGQTDFESRLQSFTSSIADLAFFGFQKTNKKKRRDVEDIVNGVYERGDEALIEYTEKFDGIKLSPDQFRVSKEDLEKAHKEIDPKLLKSLKQAIENVTKYQEEIYVGNFKHPGIKYTPIESVGICIPGASAPLPSTVIMTAVPAQVAKVKRVAVVSPPRYKGSVHPVILAVCFELSIDEVYRIGGAHAIAALAYGTNKIREVDKIVGPGNQWVQTAKQLVSADVGIDSIAGPSEVLIIANDKANPAWVAADMLSQAEHAPGSAVLFTDSKEFAENVLNELKKQIKELNRSKDTIECLKTFGGIAVFDDFDYLIKKANDFASEHLQIQCGDQSKEIADRIDNAGAIFIGDYSPVAVGDYWAGPSHTLPTGMTAKFFSPLSANDFIKSTSIIEYNKEQLAESAADIIRLAEAEGLDAHAKSIKIRQQD